jgi:SAM-dependent methyltransferase
VKTLPEVIVTLERPGEYLVSNPLVRTYALGDMAFVELLSALRPPGTDLPEGPFSVVDATIAPFAGGLLGDPTGVDREATLEGAEPLSRDAAIALAEKLMLVTSDESAYADYRAPRKNVLDRAHRGTMHQRVGEYVMLELRERDIDHWWVDQKFTPDRRDARDGLYSTVQGTFMDAYWTEERLKGRRVLDFGCGPGLFARLFAARGASVLGLDTNKDHLETARKLSADDGLAERTEFAVLELPPEVGLAKLDTGSFDLIFLSDVLMFYFHPYDTRLELDPVQLLRDLKELLAPDGRIVVLEPNGVFWQQPWLGDPARPYTIVSEYTQRNYGVTPTLEQIAKAFEDAGLAITRIRELVDPDGAASDDRGRQFAAEFPVWWLFELTA